MITEEVSISVGEAEAVSFSYTLGNYEWAQYNFTAVADSTNNIREFDEANNEKYGPDEVADALRQ
jgi:subtilase family serine protease